MTLMGVIKITKSKDRAILPQKVHGDSFGYDMHNIYHKAFKAGEDETLPSGITVEKLQNRLVLLMGVPSTPENNHIEVSRDFIGTGQEINFHVINHKKDEVEVDPNSVLSRMMILKTYGGEYEITDSLDETERGLNGYGSTGLLSH
ncbi:dUTP pyrophosphatase [Enteropsectra breve]|nr:dUTP pyrophosphatase [Enteropsectra breve]